MPNDFAVYLTFHGIGEPEGRIPAEERPYWVAADRFDEIVGMVRKSGANARITFDDGNLSDRTVALPILQKHGLAARFFVPSDRLGEKGFLSTADVRALADAGMKIGSHGEAHRPWTCFPERDVADQVARSVAALSEAAATPVTEAAAPFGAYNARVLRAVRASGVARLFTSDGGVAKAGRWLVPRNTVKSDTSLSAIEGVLDSKPRLIDSLKSIARRAYISTNVVVVQVSFASLNYL